MVSDPILTKDEAIEFGELIALLRAQYGMSWSDLSDACGYRGEPGGARKAIEGRAKRVHYSNLIALRRTVEQVKKDEARKVQRGERLIAAAVRTEVTGENFMPPKGTTLRRHTLDPQLDKKPLMDLPTRHHNNGDTMPTSAPRLRKGHLTTDERREFVKLVTDLRNDYPRLTEAELARNIGYGSGFGLGQAMRNEGASSTKILDSLRDFDRKVRRGEYVIRATVPRLRKGDTKTGLQDPQSRAEFDALVGWLGHCNYSLLQKGFAIGNWGKLDRSPAKAFRILPRHLQALQYHIQVERKESVADVLEWSLRNGRLPRINKRAEPPRGAVMPPDSWSLEDTQKADTEETTQPTSPSPAATVAASATVQPAVAHTVNGRQPNTPTSLPPANDIMGSVLFVRDQLTSISEQLGNLVSHMDGVLDQKIHPMFKPGVVAARAGLAKLNDTTIAVIGEFFDA